MTEDMSYHTPLLVASDAAISSAFVAGCCPTPLPHTTPALYQQHTPNHQVAFGTLVHLMCEGNEAEAKRVATFNLAVGLPVTLSDLHVTLSEPKLEVLVSKTLEEGSISWNLGPHLNPDLVREAIVKADKLGASLKSNQQQQQQQ